MLFICAYTDYKKSKIYNKYLIIYLLMYVLISLIGYIVVKNTNERFTFYSEVFGNLKGLALGFIICFIFYLLGIFKGGDAKLLSIVGLHSGIEHLLYHYASIFIVAGVCALYVLIKHKILFERLRRVFLYFKGILLIGKFQKYISENNDKIKFPFAVYILLGEMVIYLNYFIKGFV